MRALLWLLLSLCMLTLAGCNNTYEWNQKLTLTVQTPEGPRSATRIVRVTTTMSDAFWMPIEARGVRSSVEGEAIALELTPGNYVFMLLDGVDRLAQKAFPELPYDGGDGFGEWAEAIQISEMEVIISDDQFPPLVTFQDNSDPRSLRRLSSRSLELTFGEGFQDAQLSFSITTENLSEPQVGQILPWLDNLSDFEEISGNPFTNNLPLEIAHLRKQ